MTVDGRNPSPEWAAFSARLRRLIKDAIRLRRRPDYSAQRYASRVALIHRRLCALADATYADSDARRLRERISRHRDHLFTFLDTAGVSADNNLAEREIRPAVIIRKNSLCNRSERGATTQAVMMSIYRTLKLRGVDPTRAIAGALRELLRTGELPPLPERVAAAETPAPAAPSSVPPPADG